MAHLALVETAEDDPWWCECDEAPWPHVHCPPWDGGPTLRRVDPVTGAEIPARP